MALETRHVTGHHRGEALQKLWDVGRLYCVTSEGPYADVFDDAWQDALLAGYTDAHTGN